MADSTVRYMSLQPTRGEPAGRLPWWPLLALSGAAFVTVTTELLPASLLPELAADLRVTRSTAGLLVGAWAVTVAAVSVAGARAASRMRRATIMPLLLLGFALATLGTALAPGYGWALATRVVAASAHGVLWSLLVPTVATLVPPAALGRAVAVVLAGPAAATVAGIPLGSALGTAVGWRACFVGLAVLLVVAAAALRALGLSEAPPSGPGAGTAGRGLLRVVAVATACGLVLTGHFMVYTYVAVLLHDVGGFGADGRSVLLLVFGAGGLVGIAVSGVISDRWPRRALGRVAGAFAVSLGALGLVGAGTGAAVAVVALWGALIGLLPPTFQTRLLRLAPRGWEAVAGAVGITVLNVGIAVGAALGGLVVEHRGAAALPAVAAAVTAAAAVGLVIEGARAGQPGSPAAPTGRQPASETGQLTSVVWFRRSSGRPAGR